MSYSLPTFNLTVNIWRGLSGPPAAPDVVSKANLAYGRRVQTSIGSTDVGAASGFVTLLLPAGTDIRSDVQTAASDWVEAPAGSQRYYKVHHVDDVAKQFPNEHRAAVLEQVTTFGAWPSPMP